MLPIKLSFNKEVRRVTVNNYVTDSKLSYRGLLKTAYSLFPSLSEKPLTFLWCDDESDIVCCSTDEEVEEAVRVMKSERKTTFKFDVTVAANSPATAGAPAERSDPKPPSTKEVHQHVTCDGCGMKPIVGFRYKCTVREDFDLCENCEALAPQPHPMIKIYNPNQQPEIILVAMHDQSVGHGGSASVRCKCNSEMEKLFSQPFSYHGCAFCDGCKATIKYEDGFHHCRACGYDLCPSCSKIDGPLRRNHPSFFRKQGGRQAWSNCGNFGFGGHGRGFHGRRQFPGAGAGLFAGPPGECPFQGRRSFGRRCAEPGKTPAYCMTNAKEHAKTFVEQLKANSHPFADIAEGFVSGLFDKLDQMIPIETPAASTSDSNHADIAVCPTHKTEDDLCEEQVLEAVMRESLTDSSNVAESIPVVAAPVPEPTLQSEKSLMECSLAQSGMALLASSAGPSMRFVADVTFPDATAVLPGSVLKKVWRIKNDGVVIWPEGTYLAVCGGDNLTYDNHQFILPFSVSPGDEIHAEMTVHAPTAPGRYVSYFKLTTPSGCTFGPRLWADINVSEEDDHEWDVVGDSISSSLSVKCENSPAVNSSIPEASNINVDVVVEDVEESDDEDLSAVPVSNAFSAQEAKYARELFALREMGFADLSVVVPLLERHIPDPETMSDATRVDCLQHLIIALLSRSGVFNI